MNRDTLRMISRLTEAGITESDAFALRRISMTLQRWHEMECGIDSGYIERDEQTNKCYFVSYNAYSCKQYRTRIADRETGAHKRLAAIMANYPTLTAYIQTDPRGEALYILRPGDVPEGKKAMYHYSNGIAVYR